MGALVGAILDPSSSHQGEGISSGIGYNPDLVWLANKLQQEIDKIKNDPNLSAGEKQLGIERLKEKARHGQAWPYFEHPDPFASRNYKYDFGKNSNGTPTETQIARWHEIKQDIADRIKQVRELERGVSEQE